MCVYIFVYILCIYIYICAKFEETGVEGCDFIEPAGKGFSEADVACALPDRKVWAMQMSWEEHEWSCGASLRKDLKEVDAAGAEQARGWAGNAEFGRGQVKSGFVFYSHRHRKHVDTFWQHGTHPIVF